MAAEDYMPDDAYFKDYELWLEDGSPKTTECRQCGQNNLFWEDDNGRWRLIDIRGRVHVCDIKRTHKQAADDFDVLD